jgi:serine-aspartate repeat-containing protein C/D/E
LKSGENVIRTTSSDTNGFYVFDDVSPGNYTLFEINPPGYARDVSDKDNSNDDDSFDSDTSVDSTIKVTLQLGEDDLNIDFVDSDNGSISGTVTEDKGQPLSNVNITLVTSLGTFVATSLTDINGKYVFNDVEPGAYFVIEENPVDFPSNI